MVRNIIIKFKIQNSLEFLFIPAIAVRSARGKSIFAHKIRCAARLAHCVVKPTQGGRKIVKPGIYLWQGDITALKCDSVVNAANSALLGCFYPNHECIDNAVHTFAGVELCLACSEIMRIKGHAEKTGCAEITPAFNLPCRYVIHTVGPVVSGEPTERDAYIKKLKNELKYADAIVIGAGAGLSAAAGFDYGGERFRKYFSDFETKYGFHDMYSGGFYPYGTPEEYRACGSSVSAGGV